VSNVDDEDRGSMSQVTRRRWLIDSTLWAVAGGLGVACSKDSPASASQRGAAGLAAGGELNVAFDGAGVTTFALDPHNSGYAPHNRVMRSIYDSLTRLLPDQSVGPWLAESWEVSADRKEYTFTLKQGVKFHDGTVFDAQAVKANFDRVAEPLNILTSRTALGPYERTEVLAPDKVRLVLKEPFTPLLRNLSMTKLGIVSPTAVAKYGKTFALNPVATGPYKFVSVHQGVDIRLEKNPDYNWAPPDQPRNGPEIGRAHV
jgi:peptide/nickel transport system substrate-binding protein